jgi:hypothetical protein
MAAPMVGTNVTLIGLLTLGSLVAVQSPRPEWKLVPTMPAGAWYRDDGFEGKAQEAGQAAIAAKDQQDALNAKISEQFDKMDMMEKGQRMQAWMMRNPQAATRMLEASSDADGAAAAAEELKRSTGRLEKEKEALKKAFDSAVDRAVQPVDARIEALIKAKTQQLKVDAVFTTDADYGAYVALIDERNAAYEKASAPFFGAGGSFHRWLAAFRSDVTEKALAHTDAGTAMLVQQYAIMDTPSGGYRSTGGYDVVRTYLAHLGDIAGHRRWRATPKVRLAK